MASHITHDPVSWGSTLRGPKFVCADAATQEWVDAEVARQRAAAIPTLLKESWFMLAGIRDDEPNPQSLIYAWLTRGPLSLARAAGTAALAIEEATARLDDLEALGIVYSSGADDYGLPIYEVNPDILASTLVPSASVD